VNDGGGATAPRPHRAARLRPVAIAAIGALGVLTGCGGGNSRSAADRPAGSATTPARSTGAAAAPRSTTTPKGHSKAPAKAAESRRPTAKTGHTGNGCAKSKSGVSTSDGLPCVNGRPFHPPGLSAPKAVAYMLGQRCSSSRQATYAKYALRCVAGRLTMGPAPGVRLEPPQSPRIDPRTFRPPGVG
jgi:hypothetical protein